MLEGNFLIGVRMGSGVTRDLLKKYGVLECKPISTPMEAHAKLCAHEGKDLADGTM